MGRDLSERLHGSLYLALQASRGRGMVAIMRRIRAWERLDRNAYEALCAERLRAALRRARARIPLYRSAPWAAALAHGPQDEIAAWPVLPRRTVIERGDELLDPRQRFWSSWRHSSATTGDPVRIAMNPRAAAWSWATEYRALEWQGLGFGVKTLMVSNRRNPVLDWIRNRRVVLTIEFDRADLDEAARYLVEERPRLLWGLASAVCQLARHLRARYPHAPREIVPFVKLGGERVYGFQREEIARHLGAHVFESYGCTEVGSVAAECRKGALHVFAEHVHLEVFENGVPAPPGAFGDLVLTSLTNEAMPLVRCMVGDQGRLDPAPCSCGLPHPVLGELRGRAGDLLLTADGRRLHVSALEEVLRAFLAEAAPIEARQLLFEQRDARHWHVLLEGDVALSAVLEARLSEAMRRAFGSDCQVAVERVSKIPRATSGKYRYYARPPEGPLSEP